MAYYARSLPAYREKQLLREHLLNVAQLSREYAKEACPDNAEFSLNAYLVGVLHDLGKYRIEFQELLAGQRARTSETAHAIYGAAAGAVKFSSPMHGFAIAGHHAGLHDASTLAVLLEGNKFQACKRFPELIKIASQPCELGKLSEYPSFLDNKSDERSMRQYDLFTRMLFSMLVDADRIDSERFEQECRLQRTWQRQAIPLNASYLLNVLEIARKEKAKHCPHDDLFNLRNAIFDTCVYQGGSMPQGFFSLTVPTGGGKTLSSMAFALSHSLQHDLRRIIVVIPYLSIIEQNAKEYRKIFGANRVLEHHSAVEYSPSKHISDDNEVSQTSFAELAMENWDAPIIVTTSVQFLETLLAASPSRARRLHNIARSVVIFDEVQTMPTHMLEPTLDVFRQLKDYFGVSFVFCSATQPGFRRSAGLKQGFSEKEITEITPNPHGTYKTLRRVDYRIESPDQKWSWDRIAGEMLQQRQSLCVLNLRRHAFAAWDALRMRLSLEHREDEMQDAVFHLSSAMCPAHRLDLLGISPNPLPNNVKSRLAAKKTCWVVSTQLIEAGVDIDFPFLFRAMGPLDSIVQAAGRCNREGLLRDAAGRPGLGRVVVFHPEDNGLPPGLYSQATAIAEMYLADTAKLGMDPHVFAEYFSELHQLAPTDHSKKGEHTIQENRAKLNFRKVAEDARVIKQDTVSVIVPYKRGKKLVNYIRKTGRFDRQTLRRLQRYMVNLRHGPGSDYERLMQVGAVEPLLSDVLDMPVLAEHCYDLQLGVVIKEFALEDYFQ